MERALKSCRSVRESSERGRGDGWRVDLVDAVKVGGEKGWGDGFDLGPKGIALPRVKLKAALEA